jgi:hypothetical protein
VWKSISADIVSSLFGLGQGMSPYNATNPDTSSDRRDPVMHYVLQGRWTSTLTPKLLFQAGFSLNKEDFNVLYQPGVQKVPFTPEWYANASQLEVALLTRSVASAVQSYNKYDRYALNGLGAYVTGSHTLKFGVQDSFGPAYVINVANGDAYYRFTNGVPLDVTAYNTPTVSKPRLNADLGIYGMDTWHFKRLAVTAGLRWEYLSSQIDAESGPAGRFVPARNFAKVDCHTVSGLGCFKNWAPRLGVIYDLFGNHKTALKAGFGKYNAPIVTSVLNNFNPMFLMSISHGRMLPLPLAHRPVIRREPDSARGTWAAIRILPSAIRRRHSAANHARRDVELQLESPRGLSAGSDAQRAVPPSAWTPSKSPTSWMAHR